MYVLGMFDVRLLMVELCGVLIGVGVSAATVGVLLELSIGSVFFLSERFV
jgi:hypothetical protein